MLSVGDREIDLEVAVHDPAATVADLLVALSGHVGRATGLRIDGVNVPSKTVLVASGLRPGTALSLASADDSPPATTGADHEMQILVVGGISAGTIQGLPPGSSILGRDAACAVRLASRTTSGRHAAVSVHGGAAVTVVDLGSASGTWIDGCRTETDQVLLPDSIVALGASLVRVAPRCWRESAVVGPPLVDGRQPFHRPPLSAYLPEPAPLVPPTTEFRSDDRPRFGWASALVPLAGGLVLARFVDPRLALFTLLGPAVLIGQWVEERRRHARTAVNASAARQVSLADFARDLQAAGLAETRRRHSIHPDPALLGHEIESLGLALWSRRPGHSAFAEVVVGSAPALAWTPLTTRVAEKAAADTLARARLPFGCPATVGLTLGHHLGFAGARTGSMAVARWVLLQLAAHHGPADLRIAIVCAAAAAPEWEWTAFLPHTAAPRGMDRRLLATGSVEVAEVVESIAADRAHLVVFVDGAGLSEAKAISAALVAVAATTVNLGASRRALPGRCTTVVELEGPDGWAQMTTDGSPPQAILATGIDPLCARRWSRRLGGLADPEEVGSGTSPPTAARLLDLLGLEPTVLEVSRRWLVNRGAATPIGCSGGPEGIESVVLDLVADGPHALVAGTTGAGKSEMLRTFVAGLAVSFSPDQLVLLLVDYKGGAAFAEAARLPHVLGVVTDLGPEEAARALQSLEAEMRRREGVLAELGLRDLASHPAHRPGSRPPGIEPLPRLVVVVDELAALVAELPSFLDGLVQLAGRGRSLGLHLVLATQRPGGVVSAAVRTNCAIRCCLRVPDEADAVDVVGSPRPAYLDRRQAGRAFLRRGAADLVEVQVALVGGRQPGREAMVTVEPATFGPAIPSPRTVDQEDGSDLAILVDACCAAAFQGGILPPLPLWLPPLPPALPAVELPHQADEIVFGLADDPTHQRRLPLTWANRQGPLLAFGSGSGPAGALQAVARMFAARFDPSCIHVYVLDLAAQGLADLEDMAHVGAVIRPGEQERLHRLIQRLADKLSRRQAGVGHPSGPQTLLLVDGVAGLRSMLDGVGGMAALDSLERVVVDGPAFGMFCAVAADRLAAIPSAWAAAASSRLAFRCADPLDLLALGGRRVDQSRWPDGRCLDLTSGLIVQIATEQWVGPAQSQGGGPTVGPEPILILAEQVGLSDVLAACPAYAGPDGLRLPLGIDGRNLGVAVARLRPGHPFLICGPPGSGRSTALATMAAAARAAGCEVVGADAFLGPRIAAAAEGDSPLVVLVDDADRVSDPGGILANLAASKDGNVSLVAAVPPEAVRSAFGHWTVDLRRAGAGLVLRPRSDLDADVLGVPLLPRWPVTLSTPGRGVLVSDGEPIPIQVATA